MAATLLSGCDILFRIDPVKLHEDGGADAVRDGNNAALCGGGTPLLNDQFDPASPGAICKPWGSEYNDPGVTVVQSGGLVITPAPTTSVGGCLMDNPIPLGGGVTAIVDSVVTTGDAYNVLQIHTVDYQINMSGGALRFQDVGGNDIGTPMTYSPAMRWWRLRPNGTTAIVGEYSLDGVTFTKLGSVNVSVPSMVTVELTVGANIDGATGHGTFRQLYVCP